MRPSRSISLVTVAGLGLFWACGGRSRLSALGSDESVGAGPSDNGAGVQTTTATGTTGSTSGSVSGVTIGAGGTGPSTTGTGPSTTGGAGAAGEGGAGGAPEGDERMICSRASWSSTSEVVLSHTSQGVLTLIRADGSVRRHDLTYPDKPNDEVQQSLTVTANDALIAVASGWSSFSPTLMASVAMFDRHTGDQLFHTLLPGHYLHGAFLLGTDGSAVVGLHHLIDDVFCEDMPGPCDRIAVFEPSGDVEFFDGYSAFGPRIDGHLLVTPTDSASDAPVWLDVETGEETPLAHWADRVDTLQVGPESLRYLARTGDVVEYVTEIPTSVDVLPLDGLDEILTPDSVRYQIGNDELAYPVADGSSVWRVDLRDGSLENIELPLPAGVEPLLCYNQGVFPDDTGALTLPVRDSGSAWVMRWEGDTGPEPLGVPLTDIQALQITAAGGTYLIRSWAPGSLFCDEEIWSDAGEPLLFGDSLQLVRPADDIFEVLDSPDVAGVLNAGGTCFYRVTTDGFFLRDVFRASPISLPVGPGGTLKWVGPSWRAVWL